MTPDPFSYPTPSVGYKDRLSSLVCQYHMEDMGNNEGAILRATRPRACPVPVPY